MQLPTSRCAATGRSSVQDFKVKCRQQLGPPCLPASRPPTWLLNSHPPYAKQGRFRSSKYAHLESCRWHTDSVKVLHGF